MRLELLNRSEGDVTTIIAGMDDTMGDDDLKEEIMRCSTESTEESNSDEGMPQEFDTPSEADIMADFPKEILTPEVRTNIANVIKHMEASQSEAAKSMKCMKKLIPTIPVGAFHLILQAMVQPHIMIQHQ